MYDRQRSQREKIKNEKTEKQLSRLEKKSLEWGF